MTRNKCRIETLLRVGGWGAVSHNIVLLYIRGVEWEFSKFTSHNGNCSDNRIVLYLICEYLVFINSQYNLSQTLY